MLSEGILKFMLIHLPNKQIVLSCIQMISYKNQTAIFLSSLGEAPVFFLKKLVK